METEQNADLVRGEPEVEGAGSWTASGDPTFIKGMENIHPNWVCICDHTIHEHAQVENDAVACQACPCTDFCSGEDADEVTDAIYEWALEDGETWAATAHEYRQRMAQRKVRPDA